MAEGAGFEPSRRFVTVYTLSRRAPSTARPPVRNIRASRPGKGRDYSGWSRHGKIPMEISVRSRPAHAQIVLGRHDRDRVTRHHVERCHDQDEKEYGSRETLHDDELDQGDDENEHGESVIDESASRRSRRFHDLDEQA